MKKLRNIGIAIVGMSLFVASLYVFEEKSIIGITLHLTGCSLFCFGAHTLFDLH